jgi:hypothetical protein
MLGTVTALRRYPVKSMMGEDVDASDVSYSGLAWERRLALVSRRTSKVTSAKYPRLWRDLLSVNQHIGPERSRTPEGVSTGTCVTVLCQDMVDTGRVGWLVRRRQAADSDADPPSGPRQWCRVGLARLRRRSARLRGLLAPLSAPFARSRLTG